MTDEAARPAGSGPDPAASLPAGPDPAAAAPASPDPAVSVPAGPDQAISVPAGSDPSAEAASPVPAGPGQAAPAAGLKAGGSPRRRDSAATRAAILRAAIDAFTRSGYDGAGVREIASAAGVTAMLVNRYFGSKEQLFAEAVDVAFAPRTVVGRDPATVSADIAGTLAARTAPAADGGEEAKPPRPASVVRSGLDVLVAQDFAPIAGYTVGLVTNQTGVDSQGRRAIDLLAAAPRVKLAAIFTPEHGLTGDANTEVPHGRDPITGLPVWSLYGSTRRPNGGMLRGLDLVVFDIQDVGVRYYTYLTTLVYVMEEAARARIPVLLLDRPNPINGRVVEGPLMDPDLGSFTAPHPIPVRTGMTIGEFGRMVAMERKIPVSLTIVPLEGWERGRWFDETGLPWVNPSPNIRSLTQALLYSGIGLLESTNVSVGRGTERPFEVIGAPWLDPHRVSEDLNALRLSGVSFEPVVFTPSSDIYTAVPCGGVRLVVTDREAIRPVTVGLAIARTLRSRHRDQFRPEAIQNLLVNRATMWAFLRNESLDRLVAWTEMERNSFLNRRASYLIYR